MVKVQSLKVNNLVNERERSTEGGKRQNLLLKRKNQEVALKPNQCKDKWSQI
jgi:hypothetical protein